MGGSDAPGWLPETAMLIVGIDYALGDPRWAYGALADTAALPFPTLDLLCWLHASWQLASMEDRLAIIERWAHSLVPAKLSVVKT